MVIRQACPLESHDNPSAPLKSKISSENQQPDIPSSPHKTAPTEAKQPSSQVNVEETSSESSKVKRGKPEYIPLSSLTGEDKEEHQQRKKEEREEDPIIRAESPDFVIDFQQQQQQQYQSTGNPRRRNLSQSQSNTSLGEQRQLLTQNNQTLGEGEQMAESMTRSRKIGPSVYAPEAAVPTNNVVMDEPAVEEVKISFFDRLLRRFPAVSRTIPITGISSIYLHDGIHEFCREPFGWVGPVSKEQD